MTRGLGAVAGVLVRNFEKVFQAWLQGKEDGERERERKGGRGGKEVEES